ncbi:RHS repeat-associated core domain-containing protein [Streptomyces sp. NPDC127584]|uniref:RHS repeat-associated core domain-containing protein n=1 Tax=Streptomyces sp. NPDC127584 TaxID=3345403 RepID=UPI003635213B
MAVTVPDWADTLLDLVGVNWPNVDEDAYRDMADALREFADDLADDGQLANNHMERLLSSGHGEAMDALNEHWSKVKGKHLKDMVSAARTIAGALDLAAGAIEAMKWKAVAELGVLAGQTGLAMALIPVTGGLSALLGAGAIAFTKKQLLKLITQAMEEAVGHIVSVMTEPVVAALEDMAADLVVQVSMDALGVQNGVNLDQTRQAGKDGFDQGVQGAKEGLNLASAGSGGGSGPGGKGFHIEHDEHDQAGTRLNGVSVGIHGKTAGKLTKAKGHQGRNRGRDDIADALDPVIEKAMGALVKSAKTMGDHIGETLPRSVKQISKDHKTNDDNVRDRLARQRKGDHDDSRGGRTGAPQREKPGDSARTRPNGLRDVRDDERRHSIPLDRKTCRADPVDIATGEMTLPQVDLSLPGVLPLVVDRTHLSAYRYGHWFGRSWSSLFDERLEVDPIGGGAVWARSDGSCLVYPRLPQPGDDPVWPTEGPRIALAHGGVYEDQTTYTLSEHGGATRAFTGSPYRTSPAYWLAEISDRHDNTITLTRRPDGAPSAVSHSGGYTVQVDVADSRIAALRLRTPQGPVTVMSYGYDVDGNLDAVTDSSGTATRFAYDPSGRITSWTDRNRSTYLYLYDAAGRVVQTVGPDGFLSSSFSYDAEAGITCYTDSTGATSVFRLNHLLQVVAETDPLGNTVSQIWDRHDRLQSRTDSQGRTVTYTWDEDGNPTSVQDPDGSLATTQYDERGLPTVVTAADGSVWHRTYDDHGNNVSLTTPDGATTHYAYDPNGALAAVTDPLGVRQTYRSDGAGMVLAHTDALGRTTVLVRDAFGRPVAVTDADGAATTCTWTVEGHLASHTRPDGATRRWTYDGEGNCLTETDANGGITHYEYTHFDQPSSRTTPDGARYDFRYDTELRLTEVRNAAGLTWNYAYDAVGRLVCETDFDGRALRYDYDPSGRAHSRTNPLGQTVTTHLDDVGRVTARDVEGAVTTYTYDSSGRLAEARSADSFLALEWDAMGRTIAETVDRRTSRYGYDALSRRTLRVTPSGATSRLTHDEAGNRTLASLDGHDIAFHHDAAGRETARSFGSPEHPVVLGTAYDAVGRIREHRLTALDRTLSHRLYAYRADDRLETVTDGLTGNRRHYELDPAGRPLRVEAHGWAETYAYDTEGNQTSAQWPDKAPHPESRGGRTYSGNRLQSAGALHYTYDAAGRIVERRKKRISRKPDVWRYEWDAADRLTACTTPDGTRWTYRYDPLGRRIAKQRHADDGTVVSETLFSWDGSRLAEQTDSATNTTLTWEYDDHRPIAQAERRTTYDPGGDQDRVDARFFAIVTDLVGTPTELVDHTGATAWHSRATQWGATAWNRDATAHTPLRFPGQYADPETGLHYNFFRHYDPEAGRYVSPDPLGLDPAPNPAGYVTNPATETDPLGLAPCMQGLEDMAHKISQVLPLRGQKHQTVAIIATRHKGKDVLVVAGTSKSKLTPAQRKLAQEMGLYPLPNDQYLPPTPPNVPGGHAEQNILHYLSRLHNKGSDDWLPTHGAAHRSVCPDFCAPIIRIDGMLAGPTYGDDNPTHRRQFYWPGRHTPNTN